MIPKEKRRKYRSNSPPSLSEVPQITQFYGILVRLGAFDQLPGLSPNQVRKIPVHFSLQLLEQALGVQVCLICYSGLQCAQAGSIALRQLPCGHVFHSNCIEAWFERSVVCPTCRSDLRLQLTFLS